MVVKKLDQREFDKRRVTYNLTFPESLDEQQVVEWLRTLKGTLIAKTHGRAGIPTMVFEVWATQLGIQHKIKIPWTHEEFVIPQMRSFMPGITIERDDNFPRRDSWTRGVELGLTHSNRTLTIADTSHLAVSLLTAINQGLNANETVMFQWIVSPKTSEAPPEYKHTQGASLWSILNGKQASKDEVNDRRSKLEVPNFTAVVRVAAIASTKVRADALIFRVKSALTSVASHRVKWVKQLGIGHAQIERRIADAYVPLRLKSQVNASELAGLLAFPMGSHIIAGLAAPRSRQLPAPVTVPAVGRVIGQSTFPGAERPVALGHAESLQHLWLLGGTGSGKSVTMANIIKQDMDTGHGVVVMEPQGTLVQAVIDLVPKDRIDDVIVLDVRDSSAPVGFNLMQQGDPFIVADELSTLFEHLYESTGVWAKQVFFFGLRTLAFDRANTFVDLSWLINPQTDTEMERRRALLAQVTDPEIREFWRRHDSKPASERQRIVQPVMDRIWQLSARREIRNIIGQPESSFTMDDVVRGNKILLVSLAGLPRDTASLMGTLLMSTLWRSVQAHRGPKPTFLHLDEFQRFTKLPIEPDDLLARARGLGLGLTLAHQHIEQLPNNVQTAVLNNAKSKVIYQASSEDARVAAREFVGGTTQADFMNLERYQTIVKLMTPTGMSPPMTVANTPPARPTGNGAQVIRSSRAKYGRPLKEVEELLRGSQEPPQGTVLYELPPLDEL